MLPHRYPFVFVDAPPELQLQNEGQPSSLLVRLTQGAGSFRGVDTLPSFLAIEIVAQAAVVLQQEASGGGAFSGPLRLAGCEARFFGQLVERPLTAGDELRITLESVAAFGGLRRIAGQLHRCNPGEPSELVVEAELMLSS